MKRWRRVILGLLIVLLIAGCSSKEQEISTSEEDVAAEQVDSANEPKLQVEPGPAEQAEEPEVEEAEATDEVSESKSTVETTLYFVNDEMQIETKTIEWEKGNGAILWEELKKAGSLTRECEINEFKLSEEEKAIYLDVNQGFGNFIRGLGTGGESMVLTSVVNTYLEAFQCTKIMITEDGNTLDTNNQSIDDFLTMQAVD